ncbi:MAG: OmpA family protein [Parasphingorhabdus sp.]|uniref:OmpA family protein n=1 Tax=Parasphingorhabdus sp. TaxID=2709688 RepID=UPI003299060C
MRKLAIGLALASTALASPALARDGQWYVGVEGGAMLVEDITSDIGAFSNASEVDHDAGYDFDGIVGYDFGGFRLETEVAYKSAAADQLQVGAPGIPTVASGAGTFAGTTDIAGEVNALSFMLNGLLDFGDDDGIQGFVGGGVGVARTEITNIFAGPYLDDSDTGFAWQAIAGIRAPLSDNWDVGFKYRFFNADKIDLVDQVGNDVSTRLRTHSILGSLIYNFGGEPDAPPPPPPPPAAVCAPGPYIVFFDWDQSDITPEAATVLDNAVTAYGDCGNAQVMLAGNADKSGSASYNVGLSQRRNASVRAYLESRGINGGVISSEAFGESRPRVDTADGVREPQNRNVSIQYGPGSGN